MRAALGSFHDLGVRIGAFWRWWSGELGAMLPGALRRVFSARSSRLVVDAEQGGATLTLEGSGRVQRLGSLDLGLDAGLAQQLEPRSRALVRRSKELVIRLPPADVMSTTVVLPAATQENLRDVLAFEMDRYTPFRVDHVYYDFRVLGSDPERRKIRVQLVVTPRQRLNGVLERLSRWGLKPHAVTVREEDLEGGPAGGGAPINLLPRDRRPRRNGARSRWNRMLVALAVALAVAVITIPLVRKARLVDTLESDVAQARVAAEAAQRMRTRLKETTEEVSFLAERKRQQPAVIDLLRELTRLLPDDTWLLRFELREDRLKIQGESPTASTLISIIESSELFRDPRFGAPVTQNPRSGLERFVITARVAGPEAGAREQGV
ncbi:MAG: pilus assembly protein PilM [Gammaproteobacteria bacterium]|nr:pilus assembly protein PilM [Gammaproteobacteria bacterium]NIR90066.1 pilus assembly protein PilM [Gammaproteobacteria bacterium]NIU03270.1 pilus assembly protein PilM [Gammaproteobacteria bacterium]NIV50764.1 pilus assembly protein PilM [Gammaproteobacteria bacterium]NIV75350.1 pilus assembly protein PilM [Gammaproteobacteria bacterium]